VSGAIFNCGNCRYFNKDRGVCRFNPPTPLTFNDLNPITQKRTIQTVSIWVPVQQGEWCGKHEYFLKERREPGP